MTPIIRRWPPNKIGYALILCLSLANVYGAYSGSHDDRTALVGLIVLGTFAGLWAVFSQKGKRAFRDLINNKVPIGRFLLMLLAPLVQFPTYAWALSLSGSGSGWVVSVIDLAVEVIALLVLSRTVFQASAARLKFDAILPVLVALLGAAVVYYGTQHRDTKIDAAIITLIILGSVAAAFRIDSLRYLQNKGVDRSIAFAVNFVPAALGAALILSIKNFDGNKPPLELICFAVPYAVLVGLPTLLYFVFLTDALAREIPMVLCMVPVLTFVIEGFNFSGTIFSKIIGGVGMLLVVGSWLLNRRREGRSA